MKKVLHLKRVSGSNAGSVPCEFCKPYFGASLVAQLVKSLPEMRETWVRSLGWEDPLEKEMATHSSGFLPGEFHGQKSLAGYNPWGHNGVGQD